jgi:hypothetical protein
MAAPSDAFAQAHEERTGQPQAGDGGDEDEIKHGKSPVGVPEGPTLGVPPIKDRGGARSRRIKAA